MKWEQHKEGSPFAFLRLEPYPSAVLLDQPARDVESQTGAADTRPPGVVRAHEAPEDKAVLVLGNAHAVIPHPDFHLPIIRPARAIAASETDVDGTAVGTILDGVDYEIGEHLLNTRGVYGGDHFRIAYARTSSSGGAHADI